jgi:hypothetical protein
LPIQHKDIPNSELHEPKGVSSALINTVYVATGSGSGTWAKIGPAQFTYLSGDPTLGNQRIVADGGNNIKFVIDNAYASMNITNNTTNFAITAAADATLATVNQYVEFQGTGAGWGSSVSYEVSYVISPSRLVISRPGLYRITGWASISGFPSSSALVGINYMLNGTTHGTRPVVTKADAASDRATLFFTELVSLVNTDFVQLTVASSATGNLVIHSASLDVQLIKGA